MEAHVLEIAEHIVANPDALFDTRCRQPFGVPVASLPEARPLASLSHQAPAQRQGPLPEQQPGSLAPQAP
eukprot:11784272-Alexandrium_andersonii.AAC.1